MQDEVEKPDHYQFGQMEAWDIIELALIGTHDPVTAYHKGVALAYLLRASRKGGNTDIAKASAHLKRETARHATATPDYDTASVAFRHGLDVHPCDLSTLRGRTAPELADADGVSEYGNPITPGCATTQWRLP